MGGDNSEDYSDAIISFESGVLLLKYSTNPEMTIIQSSTQQAEITHIYLWTVESEVSINSFKLKYEGNAPNSDFSNLKILKDTDSDESPSESDQVFARIDQVNYAPGDEFEVTLNQPLELARQEKFHLFITVDVAPNATGGTLGFVILDVGLESGAATVMYVENIKAPATIDNWRLNNVKKLYLGTPITDEVIIDGAFEEWFELSGVKSRVDPPNDSKTKEKDKGNENVDLNEYKLFASSLALSFYCNVTGTILAGTPIPVPVPGSTVKPVFLDTDHDGVPDKDDPNPNSNQDTDGDGLPDDFEDYYDGDAYTSEPWPVGKDLERLPV